jgi:hypothetical protein
MNHNQGFADPAASRLQANQPLSNSRPANCGNLIIFPIDRTGRSMETLMPEHGDDAGQCSNGLSAQNYRAASTEDRAVYRKWIRNVTAFYVTMLLFSGIAAIVSYSNAGVTNLTSLSAHPSTGSPRSN